MKKIFLFFTVACSLLMSSCLKDKRFDDNEIGASDNGIKGILFPATIRSFAVTSSATPVAFDEVAVSLNGPTVSSAATKFTIVAEPTKIPAGTTLLPASAYTFISTYEIPAGQEVGNISFTLLNSGILDPNIKYGIAFTITSSDNGYLVAANAKTVGISFSVKNKYDGVYAVTGSYTESANPTATSTYPKEYQLVTTGANSVDIYNIVNGALVPGYSFSNSTGNFFFGSFGVSVLFNTATDVVTETRNYYGDPSKPATAIGTPSTGSGAPNYASGGNIRRAILDPSGINKYDAATRTVNIKYFLNQGGVNRGLMDEKWVYVRAR